MSVSQAATNTRRIADYRKRYGQVKHLFPQRCVASSGRGAPSRPLAQLKCTPEWRADNPKTPRPKLQVLRIKCPPDTQNPAGVDRGANNLLIRRCQIHMTSSRSDLSTVFNRTLGMESLLFYNEIGLSAAPFGSDRGLPPPVSPGSSIAGYRRGLPPPRRTLFFCDFKTPKPFGEAR